MFKWFAPLLLLAGKPDLLIRLVAAVIAAAVGCQTCCRLYRQQ